MFVWVGSNTPSSWLGDVFGVAAPHQLDPVMAELPERDNTISRRVRDIVATVRGQRKKHVRVGVFAFYLVLMFYLFLSFSYVHVLIALSVLKITVVMISCHKCIKNALCFPALYAHIFYTIIS